MDHSLFAHDGIPRSRFTRDYPVSCSEMFRLQEVAHRTKGCRLDGNEVCGNLYYDTGLFGEVILAYTHTGSQLMVTIAAASPMIPPASIFTKIDELLHKMQNETVEDAPNQEYYYHGEDAP